MGNSSKARQSLLRSHLLGSDLTNRLKGRYGSRNIDVSSILRKICLQHATIEHRVNSGPVFVGSRRRSRSYYVHKEEVMISYRSVMLNEDSDRAIDVGKL